MRRGKATLFRAARVQIVPQSGAMRPVPSRGKRLAGLLTDAQSRAEDQEETSMNWTEIALTITAVAQLIAALATLIGVVRGSP